jgi:hypothetical protein
MPDKFHSFHPVATILSYLTKAPLVSLFSPAFRHYCTAFCSNPAANLLLQILNNRFRLAHWW